MPPSREDIFSAANAVTTTGLALSAYGAVNIDELSGVMLFGLGRALDVIDGKVARRYHSSEFGAKFDAVADKIAVAMVGYYAWVEEVAPEPIIATIIGVNVINACSNIYLEHVGAEPHTDPQGRDMMFAFMTALGLSALGNATDSEILNTGGWVAFGGGLKPAAESSHRYVKNAWHEREQRRQPKQNTRPTPKMRPSNRRP